MAKLNDWFKENVEIERPFQNKNILDNYYPLGQTKPEKIKMRIDWIKRGGQVPLDTYGTPHRYVKGLIIFIVIIIIMAVCSYLFPYETYGGH